MYKQWCSMRFRCTLQTQKMQEQSPAFSSTSLAKMEKVVVAVCSKVPEIKPLSRMEKYMFFFNFLAKFYIVRINGVRHF